MPSLRLSALTVCILLTTATPLPAQGADVRPRFTGNLDVDNNGDGGVGERGVIGAAQDWWEQIIIAPPFPVPVEYTAGPCVGAAVSQQAPFDALCIASDLAEAPNAMAGKNLPTAPADGFQNIHICTSRGGVAIPWFVDPTPHVNEEFMPAAAATPFEYSAVPGGRAAGQFDLLSCIKHELGHVLGFATNDPAGGPCANPYTQYCMGTAAAGPTGALYTFPAGMPFAGNAPVPLAGAGGAFPSPVSHLDPGAVPGDLMNPTITTGTRRVQSTLDQQILANAFNYTLAGAPTHVPVFAPRNDFAQFGNGDGFTSELVLQNLTDRTVGGLVSFFDPDGNPLPVGLAGGMTESELEFEVPPRDALTLSTDGAGALAAGSASVDSDGAVSGVVRFSIPGIGIAGVGTGPPLREAIVPVRRVAGGINTGIAIRNADRRLGLLVECALLTGGEELATAQIELNPSGRVALFIDDLFPGVDTGEFSGSLLCRTESGSFSAIALELGRNPGEFTTLPVAAPVDSSGSDD